VIATEAIARFGRKLPGIAAALPFPQWPTLPASAARPRARRAGSGRRGQRAVRPPRNGVRFGSTETNRAASTASIVSPLPSFIPALLNPFISSNTASGATVSLDFLHRVIALGLENRGFRELFGEREGDNGRIDVPGGIKGEAGAKGPRRFVIRAKRSTPCAGRGRRGCAPAFASRQGG
jgi:hypothetical protein